MNSTLFDIEHLQQLSYERSKAWASFMDNVAKNEILEEIDINNLEDFFGPECDENDTYEELASMEDDEYDDGTLDTEELINITKTSRLSLLLNNKTLSLPEVAKNVENNQLLDIFNQTMPIINEHNRQLKESGFDRILSTFDKQKIEDKVGSWLNRHNSLYGGDNTVLFTVSKKVNRKECQTSTASRRVPISSRSCRNRNPISKDLSNDSDDSLQSGETARYIRSSRAGATRKSAPTTTMIKTYRMVKSTRDALRKKYACEKANDECHLKTLHQRRIFTNEMEYHHNHYDLARLQRQHIHDLPTLTPSSHRERRKVFRKRTSSNSCSNMDSSSDSDYYDEDQRFNRKRLAPCGQYHCSAGYNGFPSKSRSSVVRKGIQRSAMKMPTSRMSRIYYCSHSQTKSLSSSSSSGSFNSTYERRRVIKKDCNPYSDNRPCRRESECHCCNERKLCMEYKHVADTSTEEWFVENYCSPKKLLKSPSSHSNSYNSEIYATEKLSVLSEVLEEESKSKRKIKTKTSTNAPNKKSEKKSQKGTKIESNAKTESPLTDEETSFERELQMAIVASKEMYEREQEIKNKKETLKKKAKYEILPSKPLRKATRKRQTSKNDNDIEDELEVIEKLPKLAEEKDNNDVNFTKHMPTPIKILITTKQKNPTITGTEDTFFANTKSQAICNSTALSTKSQAYNRQITEAVGAIEVESNKKFDIGNNNKSKKQKNTTKDSKPSTLIRSIKKKSTLSEDKVKSKKTATARGTVTSTSIRSPEIDNTLTSTNLLKRKEILRAERNYDELSDCALVTSTTNIEVPVASATQQDLQQQELTQSSIYQQTPKGILIYAPGNRSMAPAHSFTGDGHFTITKEHLSRVIGEKPAEKFLKYYIGRKRFNSTSTVYFRPPTTGSLAADNGSSSSDSDDDLDNMGQYGDLYESINKTEEQRKNN